MLLRMEVSVREIPDKTLDLCRCCLIKRQGEITRNGTLRQVGQLREIRGDLAAGP